LATIRNYILNLKLHLECSLNHYDCELVEGINREINLINNLIDTYNKTITNCNNASILEIGLIYKNPIDIVINYISKLPSINKEEWYEEITIEQIVDIIVNTEYNKNKEKCRKIEKEIIDLGDSELCSELVGVSWINSDKMLDVVGISFKENGQIYYFLSNNLKLNDNTNVIVQTEHGIQFAYVRVPSMKIF